MASEVPRCDWLVEARVRTLIAAVIWLAVPSCAGAQTLTLKYETSFEASKPENETPMSGGFSAIVHMNEVPGVARIEATTLGCFVFVGGFDELEVTGDCERVAAVVNIKATLTINRINGEFRRTTVTGQSVTFYTGHCSVAKKLF